MAPVNKTKVVRYNSVQPFPTCKHIMKKFLSFASQTMCRYQSIFPTTASFLDHVLFTIGNGYTVNVDSGMPAYNGQAIHRYPVLSDKGWEKLINECHQKEMGWAKERATARSNIPIFDARPIDSDELDQACAKYVRIMLDESAFSEEQFLADLLATAAAQQDRLGSDPYLRPYPMSPGYSRIYDLNQNTPEWFLDIGLNFCRAWLTFLKAELENNHVWVNTKPRSKAAMKYWTEGARDYGDEGHTIDTVKKLEDIVLSLSALKQAKSVAPA